MSETKGPLPTETVAPDGAPESEQPRWRRDFPIDWNKDDYVSRRDLTKYIVLTSAALAAGQLVVVSKRLLESGEESLSPLAIASVNELPVGEAKIFQYPKGSPPRLLVRVNAKTFVAYDQACTHLQCPVVPKVKENKLHCPCHNGWFDLETGVPIAGPPRRRLPQILLEVRDETIYAVGIKDLRA